MDGIIEMINDFSGDTLEHPHELIGVPGPNFENHWVRIKMDQLSYTLFRPSDVI